MAGRTVSHLVCLGLAVLLSPAWTTGAQEEGPADTTTNTTVISLNPGQQLKGFYRPLADGTLVYKFWGIRYGQAPTGELLSRRAFGREGSPPSCSCFVISAR